MYYKFDSKQLDFKKVTIKEILLGILIIVITISCTSVYIATKLYKTVILTEEAKLIVLKEENKFSKQKLKEYILQLNIKYPHIVLAQAELETHHFTSPIFKENKNLFGFKVARIRPTTNKGENRGHAVYDTWRECVNDYALFQAAYLNDIKNQDEYFQYLKQNYAEDPNYIIKLKKIIKQNSLDIKK